MIDERLAKLRSRIEAACRRVGRDPASVTLVAVSKFQSRERILEASRAGLRFFAESRQQEALTKLPELRHLGEWHFIGHLQGNKARSVAGLFDVVESVDSLRLAEKLSQAAVELKKTLRVFAQVNISGETQKHGFKPTDTSELARILELPGLKLEGLMGMAAQGADQQQARAAFALLHHCARNLEAVCGPLELSMGMSQDFELAIEEGADLVRIGTALFGSDGHGS